MKHWPSFLFLCTALLMGGCANRPVATLPTSTTVEAACGECMFGMKGSDCDLAIRMDGHSYFVDGVNIDSLGEAHAKDGVCKAVRKAHVTGQVKQGRFTATSFELLPAGSR